MMTTLAITGCSNEEQDNLVPEEVTVNIDYDFWESGSMSRSGVDLYTNFYNKYVKTKVIDSDNLFIIPKYKRYA